MERHDVIVIGASAGGLAPLQTLVAGLPADLAASLFIVMHIPATPPSLLPQVLARSGPLPVEPAVDGAIIKPSHIYVAPPDRHLVLASGRMYLRQGPRENGSRPAIDPLFRTAAEGFGPRVLGIILSGTRADGAAGLAAVESHGGMSIVQAPDDALYPGMPHAAIEASRPDFVAVAGEIPAIVRRLVDKDSPRPIDVGKRAATPRSSTADAVEIDHETATGVPSPYSCPDCHGVLWTMRGAVARFRCRTGHDYSGDALLEAQSNDLESVLWAALRGAQEGADLARRLESDARERGHDNSAQYFAERLALAQDKIQGLRAVLKETFAVPVAERAKPKAED